MKVLYISSGYSRIYQYLDESIIDAWKLIDGITIMTLKTPRIDPNLFLRKIRKFKPDLIMTLLGDHLPKPVMEWMNNASIPSILWLTEDPYYIDRSLEKLPYFDFVFTIDKAASDYYKKLGFRNVYFLPLGTNPRIYKENQPKKKHLFHDICLVGYPYMERIKLIKLLTEETNFTISLVGGLWGKNIPVQPQITFYKKWTHPRDVATLYQNCKIVLNTYRPFDEPSNQNKNGIKNKSVNNRTFEIASCGAFQLSEYIEDLPHFFEMGKEIITYSGVDDFMNKTVKYMHDDEARITISRAAQIKVIQHHTFKHRIEEILSIIKGNARS